MIRIHKKPDKNSEKLVLCNLQEGSLESCDNTKLAYETVKFALKISALDTLLDMVFRLDIKALINNRLFMY